MIKYELLLLLVTSLNYL